MATTREMIQTPTREPAPAVFDVKRIREDFPILKQKVHGKPLVYLDNAATSQKPARVMEAILRFYTQDCANVHRGVHLLSERATEAYENARIRVQRFLNAADQREIVFVRGATEGINLVAQSYGRQNVRAGDEVLITAMEHHSNIVPWQMLCQEKNAVLRVAPINDRGELIVEEFEKLLNDPDPVCSHHARFERPGQHQSGPAVGAHGPCLEGARAGGWRTGRAPPEG